MAQAFKMSNPKGNPASLEPGISSWVHRPTQTVRVPVVLADKVLEYARELDQNNVHIVRENNSHIVNQTIASGFYEGQKVSEALTNVIEVLESVSGKKIRSYTSHDRQKLQELISALYTLCQSVPSE